MRDYNYVCVCGVRVWVCVCGVRVCVYVWYVCVCVWVYVCVWVGVCVYVGVCGVCGCVCVPVTPHNYRQRLTDGVKYNTVSTVQ